MQDKSNFVRESLKRIRSGEKSPDTIRKRRLSRIILFIDIILIIIVLMIFNRNSQEPLYYSTSLSLKDIDYRASITREKELKTYLFLLTIKSNSKTTKSQNYNGFIASMELKYKENVIYTNLIGENTNQINLFPGEVKNFLAEIDDSVIREFASKHPEAIIPQKKTLFSVDRHIPLTVIIILNIKENISAKINFNYMVE